MLRIHLNKQDIWEQWHGQCGRLGSILATKRTRFWQQLSRVRRRIPITLATRRRDLSAACARQNLSSSRHATGRVPWHVEQARPPIPRFPSTIPGECGFLQSIQEPSRPPPLFQGDHGSFPPPPGPPRKKKIFSPVEDLMDSLPSSGLKHLTGRQLALTGKRIVTGRPVHFQPAQVRIRACQCAATRRRRSQVVWAFPGIAIMSTSRSLPALLFRRNLKATTPLCLWPISWWPPKRPFP